MKPATARPVNATEPIPVRTMATTLPERLHVRATGPLCYHCIAVSSFHGGDGF